MFNENSINSSEIENCFSANLRFPLWSLKINGITVMLVLITLILTTFCSNVTLQNNREAVIEFYSIPGLYSFKTESNILILQVDLTNDRIKPILEDIDYISIAEDQFILWINEDSIHVSVSDNDNVQLIVDGIIYFANKEISLKDLSSILQQMSDKSDLNCWAGGSGAKSCTVRYGTSEVKTICREGLNPCCTREIIGVCTVD